MPGNPAVPTSTEAAKPQDARSNTSPVLLKSAKALSLSFPYLNVALIAAKVDWSNDSSPCSCRWGASMKTFPVGLP